MESLFSTFPPTSLSEWKERLTKDLKGISFEDLSTKDDNNIEIFPFYNQENARIYDKAVFEKADWEICASIETADIKTANQQALKALDTGASGLIFKLGEDTDFNFDILLNKIGLQYIYTSFIIKKNAQSFIRQFGDWLTKQNIPVHTINCNIDFDPVSHYLESGDETDYAATDYIEFVSSSQDFKNITVNTALYQNAGLNAISQLGFGLAHLNEYFYCLEKNNALGNICRVNIKMATGTSFFEEIAKLRATRILFKNLFKAYGINGELFIICQTSDIYRSRVDKYNNILRDSISGMSAVIGGCDALLVHGFDKGFSQDDPAGFSDRIARNQQLIFKEESYLNKVADIPVGSFYIESLTKSVAEKAWQYFQKIEEEGGFLNYFKAGKLGIQAETQSRQLIQDYIDGKRVLIGVNKHVNTSEKANYLPTAPLPGVKRRGIHSVNIADELLQQ